MLVSREVGVFVFPSADNIVLDVLYRDVQTRAATG